MFETLDIFGHWIIFLLIHLHIFRLVLVKALLPCVIIFRPHWVLNLIDGNWLGVKKIILIKWLQFIIASAVIIKLFPSNLRFRLVKQFRRFKIHINPVFKITVVLFIKGFWSPDLVKVKSLRGGH